MRTDVAPQEGWQMNMKRSTAVTESHIKAAVRRCSTCSGSRPLRRRSAGQDVGMQNVGQSGVQFGSFLRNPTSSYHIFQPSASLTSPQTSWKHVTVPMFLAALLQIAQTWKQPRWPLVARWKNKLVHPNSKYYFAINKWAVSRIDAEEA